VRSIRHQVDVNTLEQLPSDSIAMNEIAEVEFETNLPLFFDPYRDSRWTGSLILIDALTNATVGAAMIVEAQSSAPEEASKSQRTSLLLLPGRPELAARIQAALQLRNIPAVVIDDDLIPELSVPAVIRALDLAGVIALSSRTLQPETIAAIEIFAAGSVRRDDSAQEQAILDSLEVSK
jgi:hypothetical protein